MVYKDFVVAGFKFDDRPKVIARYAKVGAWVELVRDRDNKFDKNAIRLLVGGRHDIGFVPKELAVSIAADLDSGMVGYGEVIKVLNTGEVPMPIVCVEIGECGDIDMPKRGYSKAVMIVLALLLLFSFFSSFNDF